MLVLPQHKTPNSSLGIPWAAQGASPSHLWAPLGIPAASLGIPRATPGNSTSQGSISLIFHLYLLHLEQFGHKSINISLDVCTFAKIMLLSLQSRGVRDLSSAGRASLFLQMLLSLEPQQHFGVNGRGSGAWTTLTNL